MLIKDRLAGRRSTVWYVSAAGAASTLPTWARTALLLPTLPTTDRLLARPLTRTALARCAGL